MYHRSEFNSELQVFKETVYLHEIRTKWEFQCIKMKFSAKYFFSQCDRILKGKLHFLQSVYHRQKYIT